MPKKLGDGGQPPSQGWITEVKVTASTECPMIMVRAGVNGQSYAWLVDSGARESVLDSQSFQEMFPGMKLQELPLNMKFRTADGSPLNILGSFVTEFWFGDGPTEARVYVSI